MEGRFLLNAGKFLYDIFFPFPPPFSSVSPLFELRFQHRTESRSFPVNESSFRASLSFTDAWVSLHDLENSELLITAMLLPSSEITFRFLPLLL